jgi:hypothetical protein
VFRGRPARWRQRRCALEPLRRIPWICGSSDCVAGPAASFGVGDAGASSDAISRFVIAGGNVRGGDDIAPREASDAEETEEKQG